MKRLFLALVLFAAPAEAAEPLKVTASFSILADMAREVGGAHVEVTSLVAAGEDAHAFTPAPADAAKLAKADVILMNGLGFEGWMDRLIESSGTKAIAVTAITGAEVLMTEGVPDPHAWQDARNGVVYAGNIAEGFCKADPANCADYKANLVRYAGELLTLDSEISKGFAAIPPAQRKVITSHDAFAYFGRAYGIRLLAARGVSEHAEPTAKGIAVLISQIKAEGVKALFVETISDPRLIEQIASESGIKPAGEIYSDALSPPDGPAPDYVSLLRYNAQAMMKAMRGE